MASQSFHVSTNLAPMTVFFDTHTHLNADAFTEDVADVIRRAKSVGVCQFLVAGYDLNSSYRAVELARSYPDHVYAAVGIHPLDAGDLDTETRCAISELADDPSVVAIGETGLDFYRKGYAKEVQGEAFLWHLDLAVKHDKPAIIHVRNSFDDVLDNLQQFDGVAVAHCFSGNRSEVGELVKLGLYVSFAGLITYSSGVLVRGALSSVPSDKLVIETDSPYLTPRGVNSRRNEPSYVVKVASVAAETIGMNVDDFASMTTGNARRLFGLGQTR